MLTEEQKARAAALAEAVGDEPGKYFGSILSEAAEKYCNAVLDLLKSVKLRFYEKYPKIKDQADQASAEIEVFKEAYRIWYEKSGKNLMDQENEKIKEIFDQAVDKLQFFAEGVRLAAEKVIAGIKKKTTDSEGDTPDDPNADTKQ